MTNKPNLPEVENVIMDALAKVRRDTLNAVIEIIEHEIELSGDGIECAKRIRRLQAQMDANDARKESSNDSNRTDH
jgi:predicted transcriptional regulator